jgi:hypothetical protein
MADHGTLGRYRGNKATPPCRCAKCKEGWNLYMRNRRTRSVAERTKSRVVRPESTNVVQLKPATTTQAAAPGAIGLNEQAVHARFEQLGLDNVALLQQCLSMARVLDDPERIAQHVQACKQLDYMLDRAAQGKKTKSRGKLQYIQSMSAVGRSTAKTGTTP